MSFNLNEVKAGDLLIVKTNHLCDFYVDKECKSTTNRVTVTRDDILMFLEAHDYDHKKSVFIISFLYADRKVYNIYSKYESGQVNSVLQKAI